MISLLLAGIYALIWKKRYSIFYTLIFLLVPLTLRGYILQTSAVHLGQAITGIKLAYQGALFLLLFMMFAIFNLCNLKQSKLVNSIFFFLSWLIYIPVLTIGSKPLFYKSISLEFVNGKPVILREYGPFHTVFYLFIATYFLISTGVIIYSLIKKKDSSKKILLTLLFCEFSGVFLYLFHHVSPIKLDFSPLSYLISEAILLVVIHRISLYDIMETAIDTIAMNGSSGFISFDKKFTYIASNQVAKEVFPSLKEIRVDSNARKNEELSSELISKILDFKRDNSKAHFFKECGDKIYRININFLYAGKRRHGYMIYIEDDTRERKYISLLNGFNERLKEEVAEKTGHIERMHNNLILGMATMVESRDNSTGGHIKRTSDVVKILVEEIQKDKSDDSLNLSDEFCHNLIKAAPMHDLGKIAVDDAILRKPGKFTSEEFEMMKKHTTEGARIVHEILKGTDDTAFHLLAENVAHYHHERWDGSGYPKGLKGEKIPLEARIMAVADVYDALVSKRVYKDRMSFSDADKIIMESMGRHFDKRLEKYYCLARPKLESYYSDL